MKALLSTLLLSAFCIVAAPGNILNNSNFQHRSPHVTTSSKLFLVLEIVYYLQMSVADCLVNTFIRCYVMAHLHVSIRVRIFSISVFHKFEPVPT